jgi:hypothetical protein
VSITKNVIITTCPCPEDVAPLEGETGVVRREGHHAIQHSIQSVKSEPEGGLGKGVSAGGEGAMMMLL